MRLHAPARIVPTMAPRILLALLATLLLTFGSRAAFADEPVADDDSAQADAPADTSPPLEQDKEFAGVPHEVGAAAPDAPPLSAERMRAMVSVARTKVLDRLERNMDAKSSARMSKIAMLIRWFSLLGLLLLAMPLVLRKRYPGQGAQLFKYSALAAGTFVLIVNLFGLVVVGYRTTAAALGTATNPQLHIASGFFDVLDAQAETYQVLGNSLFGPTLEQLQSDTDEQPAAVLIENGQQLIKDASVFVTIARTFKKLDFLFAMVPTVMLAITMLLFILAIKPTLLEIIALPAAAAAGTSSGQAVVHRALRRVGGELVATICTVGVLVVLTLVAGAVLSRVVGPALDALIAYFTASVLYLESVPGAASGPVFVAMISVVVFLALNLVAVIATMVLFLGKAQQIFQRKFNDGVALRDHLRFWKWGPVAVLVALLVPWLFVVVADKSLDAINNKLGDGAATVADVPWTTIMYVGAAFLVIGFLVTFWALRGVRAIAFLARYKVPKVA